MKALITGITGQDGSYLAELLLSKGYEVFGLARYCSTTNTSNIDHLLSRITLIHGDLMDSGSLREAVKESMPDEVYNLGALSFVGTSWRLADMVREVNYHGLSRLLYAVEKHKPDAKVYQASTSEMFGGVDTVPQNEQTPFNAVSPYAESKVEAHRLMQRKRVEGMYTACGILFNHESPRRGESFVTRKITSAVARIVSGEDHILKLGNMNAEKDWGFAGDYVDAMWRILSLAAPNDYAIGTGEKHTVREFVTYAFAAAGKTVLWEGNGADERGYVDGLNAVEVDPSFFRPHDTKPFLADASKAKKELGWHPVITFKGLVGMMVESDLRKLHK